MDVPTDVLVEILLRLSPICRRRLRLVCRLWRDLIHERTPKIRMNPAKALIDTTIRPYVVDDVLGRGKCTALWPYDCHYGQHLVVGTCNGLICLCDNTKPGGAIILANPITNEVLYLPLIPGAGQFRRPAVRSQLGWHDAYSFAYHSITGQYKIVHVPCDVKCEEAVQVFTLGESSWRDVPARNARCRLRAGLVSLDGATYWVTEGAEKIMSFDLEGERVTSTVSPPVASTTICHLAEVRGRLAVVISDGLMGHEKIEVWILGEEQKWSHQYNMQLPRPGLQVAPQSGPGQRLARPHLAHGMAILTHGTWYGEGLVLYEYEHTVSEPSSVVQTYQWKRRPLDCKNLGRIHRTFAYTETTEPLSVYRLW